jgi:hypothetical protein
MKVVSKSLPYFNKAWSLFSAKGRGVGGVMHAIGFPLCLKNVFGKSFQPILIVGIEAVSALSISYGNDLHIPSESGKRRLYIVPEGYFCILELL